MQDRITILVPRTLATTLALFAAACTASASSLGTFQVNGKDASLSSAVLVGMPPANGVPRMVLVLSEKAPPAGTDANAAMMENPNAFGAAVTAVLLKFEGESWSNTTGCSIAHPASKNKHGNYLGADACKLTDVSVANGEFHARLATAPSAKDGDDAIAIDVKLSPKMP
jgi:hypothetical protein